MLGREAGVGAYDGYRVRAILVQEVREQGIFEGICDDEGYLPNQGRGVHRRDEGEYRHTFVDGGDEPEA